MMELLAPILLALLFVVFGLSHRGRSPGRCAACTGTGDCKPKTGAAKRCSPPRI